MQLWECGRTQLKEHIGPAGKCRVTVIDLEKQVVTQHGRYRGTMADPQPLQPGQVEVTWAEAGAVRIIAAELGSAAAQHWRWSQPGKYWEQGSCPPDQILQAALTSRDRKENRTGVSCSSLTVLSRFSLRRKVNNLARNLARRSSEVRAAAS